MNTTYAAYGSIGFSLAIVGIPLYIYMPTFYSQHVGIDVGIVGMVLLIARLIDMIADPIIGHLSDHSHSRYGKSKPFIIIGSLLLLVGYGMIISPPHLGIAPLWLFGFSLVMYLGWSMISVPYLSMSSEISSEYHAKTSIASYREVLALLGMISALLIPYLLDIADQSDRTLTTLFLLLLITLPLSVIWMVAKVSSTPSIAPSVPFWEGLALIKNSNSFTLLGAYTLNALANAIPSTLFLYYVSLILGREDQSGTLLLLYFVCGIVALPLWLLLSRHYPKRRVWIASMVLASCAFMFVPFLGSDDLIAFGIIVALSGFSLGADLVFSSSMQADAAQSYERSGLAISGTLFGLWGMGTKLSLALGVGIAFGILGLVGFDPSAPNPTALTTLAWLYGGAPVALKLLSIALLSRYREMK